MLAAIRCGKSLISAVCAVRMAMSVDLSKLGPGEVPRIPVLATDKDTAQVVFNHLVGNLQASDMLRPMIVGNPSSDAVELYTPSGRKVEIKVTALSRAGSTLVGRWLAGCIFDEAPRMGGDEETVLSLDQARHAVRGRLLKGAQILYPGSPWAPAGPIYEMTQKYFGHVSNADVLVIRAPGWVLNPYYWTPERLEKEKKADPTAYMMNVCAEFGDPEQTLIPSTAIEACRRASNDAIPSKDNLQYVAAMDPATRGNAWTLTILSCEGMRQNFHPIFSCVLAKQWRGSPREPLSPDQILREIADICQSYGLDNAITDQYAADALTDIARRYGFRLYPETLTGPKRLELFDKLRLLILEEALSLPNDPFVYRDLISVKKRLTTNGYTIVLPSTGDGRHSDYAAALALAMTALPGLPREKPKQRDKEIEEHLRRFNSQGDGPNWDSIASRLTFG
jgi:hypothetical protein